jgi:hypothetical protein
MKQINRIAFLQDYTGHPENLLPLLPEVKKKGYSHVAFSAMFHELNMVKCLSEEAHALGLKSCCFTAYMKYQQKYLSQNIDHRMVCSNEDKDQDNLDIFWGCPFNLQFLRRYLDFLQVLATYHGVDEIWVNDEAALGTSESSFGCYCASCRNLYEQEFNLSMPEVVDWHDQQWKIFIAWRFKLWSNVHGKMKRAIKEINPKIRVAFLTSPSVAFSSSKNWVTGIDLAAMTKQIDGIYTDPYYTFHHNLAINFIPRENYLSEWCRFLSSIMPEGKNAGIVPQGFSHATFSRPLSEADGYWSALIPVATGITNIAPYTYTLQKKSPVQKSYEKCLKLDKYFEQVDPLKYAALVYGFNSGTYSWNNKNSSYDLDVVLPCAESLRQHGIPYQYLHDSQLQTRDLSAYKILILPQISCLSLSQFELILEYWKKGGNLLILGQFATYDELGQRRKDNLLLSHFGINFTDELSQDGKFELLSLSASYFGKNFKQRSNAFAKYQDGVYQPVFSLNHACKITHDGRGDAIGIFSDKHPALIVQAEKKDCGRMAYFAGIPNRLYYNANYQLNVQNLSTRLFASATEWVAGSPSELNVDRWPPNVPMNKLRPCDPRLASTMEFFPLKGKNCFIGMVVSYFKEPCKFKMSIAIPRNAQLIKVTELITQKQVKFSSTSQQATINVEIGFDTSVLVYWFELDENKE